MISLLRFVLVFLFTVSAEHTTGNGIFEQHKRTLKGSSKRIKCGKDEERVTVTVKYGSNKKDLEGLNAAIVLLNINKDGTTAFTLPIAESGGKPNQELVFEVCQPKNSCYLGLVGDRTTNGIEKFSYEVDGKTVFKGVGNFGILET